MADQLRAVALLGIVLVNVPYLAISGVGYTDASVAETIDWVVATAAVFVAEGKFYLIFSMLFGYSTTFIVRADRPDSQRRYRRRLMALAVLGVLHAMLFFIGDILLSYALLGFVLMWVMTWPDGWVMRMAQVAWIVSAAWLFTLLIGLAGTGFEENLAAWDRYDEAMAAGSFVDTVWARASVYPETLLTLASLQWALALAAFCVGLVAGRHRIFADPGAHRRLWRRLALWGMLIGLPLQAASAWLSATSADGFASGQQGLTGIVLGFVTAPVLSAGYIGVFGLLCWRAPSLFGVLEPAGRMSLSVYLGESVLLCWLYCGWGVGWFGTQGAAMVTGVAAAVWFVLAAASWLWLRHYSRGPMEYFVARWTKHGVPVRTA